jgi:hypothetical protein
MVDAIHVGSAVDVRRPIMSWLSIVAGWLVALGVAWLFYVLGLAVGFSSFDVSNAEMTAKGVGIGTTVWVVLTWAVSLFLGGMFASWVDGRPNETIGSLHGIAVWGLATSVTMLLAAAGFTNLLQGGAALLRGGAAAAGTAAAAQGTPSDTPLSRATGSLGAQLRRAVVQGVGQPSGSSAATGGAVSGTTATPPASGATPANDPRANRAAPDGEMFAAVASDLLRGKPDDAATRLSAETGLQPAEASTVIKNLSPQVEKYKAELKESANQVRRYTAAALWAVFLSSFIALVAAAVGGLVGAKHVHRVHDTSV